MRPENFKDVAKIVAENSYRENLIKVRITPNS